MALAQYYATGRRKTATARVYLRPGAGVMVSTAGPSTSSSTRRRETGGAGAARVRGDAGQVRRAGERGGGGEVGQAGAIRHGLARALVQFDPALRPKLKEAAC